MIRERMRHRKNLFQRMLSVMLVFALVAASALGTGRGIRAASDGGTAIYLDGVSGDNSRDGKSEDEAVATFSKAKELVGDKGTIRVCGTVTVSGSQSWSLGGGVSLKRAHGFTDAVAHVTGSLKLSGITLYNKDITGSGSVSGLAGRSPAADITVPSTVTLVQPKALSEVSLSDQCFGVGSFVWADGSFVPDKYETQAQIIFTPSDTDEHDYSGLKGWNGESVIRKVKVLTQSFLEEDKKEDGSDSEDQAEADEKAEDADKTGTDEKAEDADKTGTDEKAEDAGQADGTETSGDEKPEDGSDQEDGKADGESGKEDIGGGEADSEPGKEDQDPEDGKTDTEPGKEQKPEGGEDDAPKGDDAEQPGGGDNTPAVGEQPGSGDDTPAGEEQPGDGSEPGDQDGEKPADETDGEAPEGQPGTEDEKDEPAETWSVEKVEQLLGKLPETITCQSDVDAVVQASGAYEQLSDEAQAAVSGDLLDKLYEAQSRVLGYNRVSLGVSVQGDLPWYIQFRASVTKGQKIDDSTMRTLLGSYEFKLWNLVTDTEYKLNGKTVTVLMAAPAVKDTDIVIYHYLEDGTVEQIIPEIEGDQMSFVTSSFSPFSVIGVSVAGSTELVGSTGFSYIDKKPGTGSGSSSTGNKNGNGSSTGNSSSAGNRNTGSSSSSSTRNSSSSSSRPTASGSSSTGVRRATAVGTGDTNNLLGYAMVGSGAVLLMLFAAYMVYVQYKRKSYSRRS